MPLQQHSSNADRGVREMSPTEDLTIYMSEDDGDTWVKVFMPVNSLPFHQVRWFGIYKEGTTEYANATMMKHRLMERGGVNAH